MPVVNGCACRAVQARNLSSRCRFVSHRKVIFALSSFFAIYLILAQQQSTCPQQQAPVCGCVQQQCPGTISCNAPTNMCCSPVVSQPTVPQCKRSKKLLFLFPSLFSPSFLQPPVLAALRLCRRSATRVPPTHHAILALAAVSRWHGQHNLRCRYLSRSLFSSNVCFYMHSLPFCTLKAHSNTLLRLRPDFLQLHARTTSWQCMVVALVVLSRHPAMRRHRVAVQCSNRG